MRKITKKRKTNETEIEITLNLDGEGKYQIDTPCGFLNHMLDQLSRHSGIDLKIKASGDTHIDAHHTVEDTGILLGEALLSALGDKKGIARYGWAMVPMDEARAETAIDISGRGVLVYDVEFPTPWDRPSDFDYSLIKEFLIAFSRTLGAAVHVSVPCGENNHHMAEAIFKSLAKSLEQAIRITGSDIPSTKGKL